MRLPVLTGVIKRRLLVNFRVDPEVAQAVFPAPFRPKLHGVHAIAGICLIRLEQIRPAGFPAALGISSENAAHRFAVEWTEGDVVREGVFIPRRDTGSILNHLAGGRLFPGTHHFAKFNVTDDGARVDLEIQSDDQSASVQVHGSSADHLPTTSCFDSLAEASAFFEGGSLGYSVTSDANRFDGLSLRTEAWRVQPFAVEQVESSFFANRRLFPTDTVAFDHALLMREIPHEWHAAADLFAPARSAAAACSCPACL